MSESSKGEKWEIMNQRFAKGQGPNLNDITPSSAFNNIEYYTEVPSTDNTGSIWLSGTQLLSCTETRLVDEKKQLKKHKEMMKKRRKQHREWTKKQKKKEEEAKKLKFDPQDELFKVIEECVSKQGGGTIDVKALAEWKETLKVMVTEKITSTFEKKKK